MLEVQGTKNKRLRCYKLTPEDVLSIRAAYWAKGSTVTYKQLAQQHGVSITAIFFVVNRVTWAWLAQPGEVTP